MPPPPPPSSSAGQTATLEGVVYGFQQDSLNAPALKDVQVQVYRFTGDSVGGQPVFELVATEQTNGAGKFQVKNLDIGVYRIVFTPPAGTPYRVTEAYVYVGSCGKIERRFFVARS